jgi:Rhodopirellula transposase DDE domain
MQAHASREDAMELTAELKTVFIETAKSLQGFARRRFQAQTVKALGVGGQRLAERELGWNRQTLRKAAHELESGLECIPAISTRRRKRAEEHLPRLLDDITALVDGQSQTDPQFRSKRLYTRLTAAEVRRQLIAQKGYQDVELPTVRTILTKLNDLGYHPSRVAKTKPQKKSPKPMPSSSGLLR